MRIRSVIALTFALALCGCATEAPEAKVDAASPADSTGVKAPVVEGIGPTILKEIKVGMSMAEVDKILGTPESAKHEHAHGASHGGGGEIDTWIYKDREVKFENGFVVK